MLATLKTVESLWKHEKQTRNALEIAAQSGRLYDKFVGFVDDLENVGKQINNAGKSYDEAHKKLTSGKGNLLRQTEKLKELGAKTSKSLPLEYLNED